MGGGRKGRAPDYPKVKLSSFSVNYYAHIYIIQLVLVIKKTHATFSI